MSDALDDVSAVIVNYNAGSFLARCVESLRRAGVSTILVVDNRSTDGSLRELAAADQSAGVLVADRNCGYGGGANRGAEGTSGDLLLVCNPDTVAEPDSVRVLAEVMRRDESLAVVGPRLLSEDGTVYPSARTFPRLGDALGHAFLGLVRPGNRFSRRYKMQDGSVDLLAGGYVDWVSGAFFLARRSAFEKVGGFDESYFMYAEDVDLCWRLGNAGWRVRYVPAAVVSHLQGVSTRRHPYRMIGAHHRSLWRFATRSTEGRARLALPLIAAGLLVRTLLAWLDHLLRAGRAAGAIRRSGCEKGIPASE